MSQFDHKVINARKQAAAGDLSGALQSISQAILEAPNDGTLKLFRARLLHALGQDRAALQDLPPLNATQSSPQLMAFRAEVEEGAGNFTAAIAALGHLIDGAQKTTPLLAKRAVLHQALGQFNEARTDLLAAIKANPADGELYRLLGAQHRFTKGDPLLGKMRKARTKTKSNSAAAAHLDFAISKALDDLDQPDQSFKHLLRANAIMRKLHPYDIQDRLSQLAQYKRAFASLPAAPTAEASTAAPIFITGLPRSGTTLVEQILSAHPDVTGGGEMAIFGTELRRILGDLANQPADKLDLTPQNLATLGHAYVDAAQTRHPQAARITDKSIQTAVYMGAVAAALPNARIIVVKRNPHGNALSLLRQVFQPGKQTFSYNLADIRAYQDSFDDIAAFWQTRLPDRVHTINYEDLVTTPEQTTRDLLAMAGLAWNDACLHPEENTRAVQTLSAVAVRKPINTRAAHSWHRYATQLGAKPTP